MARTLKELQQRQMLPLKTKIEMSSNLIRDWVTEFGEDGVYVSFSGGKDSTVLLHLVRSMYPDVEGVYIDTGLEYPELRDFVKTFDHITWLKPDMVFVNVIKEYGYPFMSKEVASCVDESRQWLIKVEQDGCGTSSQEENEEILKKLQECTMYPIPEIIQNSTNVAEAIEHTKVQRMLGIAPRKGKLESIHDFSDDKNELSIFQYPKYSFLLDAPFNISSKCCDVMKKKPAHSYAKQTGKKPMTAVMASESKLRTQKWIQNGCNGFNMTNPISNPLTFWTDQDILLYCVLNDITLCEPYGKIVVVDYNEITDYCDELWLFDPLRPTLKTTGCDRTGCVFCGFGCQLEKEGEGRFERMKITHPRLYEYVFADGITVYTVKDKNGHEIKVRNRYLDKLSRWVEQNRDNPNFIITEKYIPNVGLGFKYVIDWMNEHGNLNIKY